MLKKFLLLLGFITAALMSKAQTPTVKSLNINQDENKIYTSVQQRPEYPGGFQAFQQYIKTNVRYPDSAVVTDVQLPADARFILVDVRFIVERDGSLVGVKAVQGISASLDAEAVRLVRNMPKWRPGLQDNRPVRTLYSLSINFNLKEHSADWGGYPSVNSDVPVVIPKKSDGPADNDPSRGEIFNAVEQMPQYPGGRDKFIRFLIKTVRYPARAVEHHTQGTVIVGMVVEKDGSLSDVKVQRGIGDGCDEEAVRVVKLSAPWTPGTQNGQPVRVMYAMPISFTLAN